MTDTPVPTGAEGPGPRRRLASWGLWAMIVGALACVLFFVQFQLLTQSSEEAVPIGQAIGEIAGEIRRSAWRSFLGLPAPEPEVVAPPPGRDWIDILMLATPILGGIAIALSAISLAMRENWRFGFYGILLGGGAMLMQYLWWMAALILVFVLLFKILENMDGIFGLGG